MFSAEGQFDDVFVPTAEHVIAYGDSVQPAPSPANQDDAVDRFIEDTYAGWGDFLHTETYWRSYLAINSLAKIIGK